MNIFSLLRSTRSTLCLHRSFNCWTAAITKKHRKIYLNTYPTYLVLPDGSSINVDCDIPRRIIILPLDVNTLSPKERQHRFERRKIVVKAKIVDEYQDDFDERQFYNV